MTLSEIYWPAVLVAGISAFAIGGLWYGPLFGKAWQRANNFSDEALAARNMARIFVLSLLLSLVAAAVLAAFIGEDAGAGFGAAAGAAAGLGWVATLTGIQYLFETRPLSLFAINAGYSIVTLTVMGAIIGAM